MLSGVHIPHHCATKRLLAFCEKRVRQKPTNPSAVLHLILGYLFSDSEPVLSKPHHQFGSRSHINNQEMR